MQVTLATGIPQDVCRAANLGYLDPAAVDRAAFAADPDTMVVPRAGEIRSACGRRRSRPNGPPAGGGCTPSPTPSTRATPPPAPGCGAGRQHEPDRMPGRRNLYDRPDSRGDRRVDRGRARDQPAPHCSILLANRRRPRAVRALAAGSKGGGWMGIQSSVLGGWACGQQKQRWTHRFAAGPPRGSFPPHRYRAPERTVMSNTWQENAGLLALRAGLGGTLVAHGVQKLFGWLGGHGLTGTATAFEQMGFQPGRPGRTRGGTGRGRRGCPHRTRSRHPRSRCGGGRHHDPG